MSELIKAVIESTEGGYFVIQHELPDRKVFGKTKELAIEKAIEMLSKIEIDPEDE